MKRIKIGLLIFNIIAVFIFLSFYLYGTFMLLGASGRVAELDRVGVFNKEKLKDFNPGLANNLRYNVGYYIAEHERNGMKLFSIVGIITALINIIFIVLFRPNNFAKIE